jgi:anti-sigma factor RsiW
MIDYKAQLKLQAFLDGELSEAEARTVAESLGRDPEGAALLAEMRQTGQALDGFEADIKVPESREFYWSKIQREIERQERPARTAAPVPWLARLRGMLLPAATVSLIITLGLLTVRTGGPRPGVEVASSDSGVLSYHDYTAGTTLVWVSYPADNEVADGGQTDIIE